MRHTVIMVTSSYPRFPGDTVGTFMEPIATGVAALGHRVHVVAPWHPELRRARVERGVNFHFFRYAPVARLSVFGYAGALEADVSLRASAVAVAPSACLAGWWAARRLARRVGATIIHGHWVVPGGAIGAAAAGGRPLVVSLHGSDVYVTERHAVLRRVTRSVFDRAAWVTACSEDLKRRAVALGADPRRLTVVPYGVDTDRFRPDPAARSMLRAELSLDASTPVVVTAGRLVRKKGFDYLLEALPSLIARRPTTTLLIAGQGDLDGELRTRARALGVETRVRFLGAVDQHRMPALLAAADVVVVPSVRDEAGNVDGLPNTVMEALASGTPLVTTDAGGIEAVAQDGRTARVVAQRDPGALAAAIDQLLDAPLTRAELGGAARDFVRRRHGWTRVAERLASIYDSVATPPGSADPAHVDLAR